MYTPSYWRAAGTVFVLMLPALLILLFSYFIWMGQARDRVSPKRRLVFGSALCGATLATILCMTWSARYVAIREPVHGLWIAWNWTSILLWGAACIGALFGKGISRILLLAWAALIVWTAYGVYGIALG